MQRYFDIWPALKEIHGKKLLVFTGVNGTCLLIQQDAVDAASKLDEDGLVVFGQLGAYWEFQAAHRAIYFRRLEAMGEKIVYVGDGEKVAGGGLKASKVRLPERTVPASGPRQIDGRTGRVYVGRAAMGTFWWCPKTQMVYMRHGEHRWLGFYCFGREWNEHPSRVTERLVIPA